MAQMTFVHVGWTWERLRERRAGFTATPGHLAYVGQHGIAATSDRDKPAVKLDLFNVVEQLKQARAGLLETSSADTEDRERVRSA